MLVKITTPRKLWDNNTCTKADEHYTKLLQDNKFMYTRVENTDVQGDIEEIIEGTGTALMKQKATKHQVQVIYKWSF